MPALKAAVGQVLDGRFHLVEEMARGGMSTLFKAHDLERGHAPVVVKIPLPLYSSGLGSWSIFQREEEMGRRLDHPFVLKFLRLDANRRRSYVVTEYVPGRTLAQRIAELGVLAEAEALSMSGRFSFGRAVPAIGSAGYLAPEQRALRRDPGQRYPTAAAMRADLDHPERVVVSGLSERLQAPTSWRRRWRVARYVAVVGVLPVLAQVVLFRLLWLYLARHR